MFAKRIVNAFTNNIIPKVLYSQPRLLQVKHLQIAETQPSTYFFSSLCQKYSLPESFIRTKVNGLLIAPQSPLLSQERNFIKFSARKGKRKTVHAVIKRFYRLHWGIWIRTISGRYKKMWKKSVTNKRNRRQHVFTNATQSYMLDKMVCNFWKRPKYYIDDPYTPYHSRENFRITQTKPWRPEGVDYE